MFVNDCLREQQKKRRHLDRRPLAADHISLFLISSVKMNLSDVTSTEREKKVGCFSLRSFLEFFDEY